jgi:hypothetical protein
LVLTRIAKYLPGNVWQYYGRIWAITSAGGSLGAASLSVLIEPLLMAAAALIIALTGSQLGWGDVSPNPQTRGLQVLGLCVVLLAVHPRFLKGKPTEDSAFWIEATAIALLDRYFSAGVILSVVAVFRLVSILAEATGAGLATLSERRWGQK